MRALIVGSGGREHALVKAFARSARVSKIYCAQGNAGIAELAELADIGPTDVAALAAFAEEESIDLTFVGGETSLAAGIVDEFEGRGLKIVGPSSKAARLESSKAFAKDFMIRHGIPTAAFESVESADAAREVINAGALQSGQSTVVLKADGLAAGKGVIIAEGRETALSAIDELQDIAGPAASQQIVIEEYLEGREVSLLMFCDGNDFKLMPATRDHKRIGEGDTGPNTGGMGTVTDSSLLNEEQTQDIIDRIIRPTLSGCRTEGFPFRGILFLGLMMTADGPKLLEYNVRFGDPEAQAILIRLNTDIVEIVDAMLDGNLADYPVEYRDGSSACVILAAEGYPASPRRGDVISGLEEASMKDIEIFHSGTARNEAGELVTAGGRVLGVTAAGEDLETTVAWAYHAASKISWPGLQMRRDIGRT